MKISAIWFDYEWRRELSVGNFERFFDELHPEEDKR